MRAHGRERQPIFNLPPATKALLAANVVVFVAMLLLPASVDDFIVRVFGFAPERYSALWRGPLWVPIVDPLTYQFLHGGITHIGVNMLGLVAFGAGVEQRMGGWRFLFFYLVCGVIGAFTEAIFAPGAGAVMIGASAAVSGLFGAILRFPAFRRGFWLLVGLWFVLDVVTGMAGIGAEGVPVAWVAHIGGFIAGLALYPLLVRREFRGR
ncbi:MAG: rhomboid family intramembrane serine protease [Stellaceae bacterium]